jgi:ferritin-like metal-binding protein YciE
MKLVNLQDLFIEQLRDLYNGEHQMLVALPKFIKGARSPELQDALAEHLQQTRAQAERLDQILKNLGATVRGKKCKAIECLLLDAETMLKAEGDHEILDAALIAAVQRVEHFEMAGYGCARSYAQQLSNDLAVSLLEQSLEEEQGADKALSRIAEMSITREAAVG